MEPATKVSGSRIAFFGGSFDPPHLGHLAVARAARASLDLDTVLFAPVGAQPLKPQGSTASFEDRLAMTRLAIAGEVGFEVSLADAPKASGSPNYTLETLQTLSAGLLPGGELFFLMGADSFFGMKRWHRVAEIPFAASLIVASRPGQRPEEWIRGLRDALPAGLTIEATDRRDHGGSDAELRIYRIHNAAGDSAPLYLLPGLHADVSASDIRGRIHDQIREREVSAHVEPEAKSELGGKLLPDAVLDYIRAHGLYR
jgi:nicotinate-nucleotide adenylyltransferase